MTNEAGVYGATNLISGLYQVEASLSGFKTALVSSVTLEVNANQKVDISLEVGATTEKCRRAVPSAAAANRADESWADGGAATDRAATDGPQSIQSHPACRWRLAAGACDGCGNNGNLRINGDRPRNQDYVLDGTTITAPVFGGQAINPSSIRSRSSGSRPTACPPSTARPGGGVSLPSRRAARMRPWIGILVHPQRAAECTQLFRGSDQSEEPVQSERVRRDDRWSARYRNKLFFFTRLSGSALRRQHPVTGVIVPDAAFRNWRPVGVVHGRVRCRGGLFHREPADPVSGHSAPVPFNRIPTAQITAISRNFLESGRHPALPGRNPGTTRAEFHQACRQFAQPVNARVDYQLSASDQVFGVSSTASGPGTSPIPAASSSGRQVAQIGRATITPLTLGWYRTFTPDLLNNFRFGYMHRIGHRTNLGQGSTSPVRFRPSQDSRLPSSVPDTADGKKCGTPGLSVSGIPGLQHRRDPVRAR